MSTIVFTFQIPYYFVKRCFFLKKKIAKGFFKQCKGRSLYNDNFSYLCIFDM